MIQAVVESKGRGRYCLRTEDGCVFELYRSELLELGLPAEEGEIFLAEKDLVAIRAALVKRCLRRSGALLTGQDYSEKKLSDKLTRNGYPPEVIREVIAKLREAHYLDDARYAEQFIAHHLADRSILRIREDLKGRGISEAVIEKALAKAEENEEMGESADELQRAQIRRFIAKRGMPEPEDHQGRARLMAALYRKGYSAELIRSEMQAED